MGFVSYVWLIPALPLAALVLVFFVTRPLDLLSRREPHPVAEAVAPGGDHAASLVHSSSVDRYAGKPGEPGAPEGPEGAADIDTQRGAHGTGGALEHEHDETTTAHEDDHGGGHGGHGARTTFWGLASSSIGIVAMGISALLAIAILIQYINTPSLLKTGYDLHLYDWFNFGGSFSGLNYPITFRVDTLTAIMLVVVTSVSFLVHLYSVGYMAGDPGYPRFYIELALFTVAMLILVLGANLLVLFIGWELVGLSSYLLIGFWFYHAPPAPGSDVPYPPPAQLKAFITTRLGDFGMMIGLLILFTQTGTFNFVTLNNPATYSTLHIDKGIVTTAMILIFCGAVGKSAQFPLHVWLPDAMAGPTPVSALIHAATMVAAGVYLVARLFPLYSVIAGPQALQVVGYIGAFTAFFAATIALTQNDIKGVLAYSTISQLGYMFTGLAVAETNSAGIYHLFTHAFFKALLFLGSGSVIHAIDNQDMRKMGGLAKLMPITALTFLVATLSISGIPPFSGFWSKDPIIGLAYERGDYIMYGLTLFTAFLTAFYMFRLFFMTFGGRGGAVLGLWGGREQYRGEAHPHESPWMMWTPLAVLALITIGVGIAGFFGLNAGFAQFLNSGVPVTYTTTPSFDTLTIVGVGVAIVGVLAAWSAYGVGIGWAQGLARNPVTRPVYLLLAHRYYIDELYALIIKYVVLGLCNFAAGFDRIVIDGIVNGSARFVRGLGSVTRRSESGELQNYGAALFGGAMIILLVFFIAVGAIGH